MQPECDQSVQLFPKVRTSANVPFQLALVALTCAFASGCEQKVSTLDPPAEQPFKHQQLAVFCSSSVEPAVLIDQYVREWQVRQSITSTIRRDQPDHFSGDVAIVTAAELPLLADSGRFLAVPDAIAKNNENPFQWYGLLPSFAGPIVSWGGVEYGLPLVGEGHVLVYRKDLLQEAKLGVPASWEDYLAAAKALSNPHRPSLPPLPKKPLDLEVEFYLMAASYDRQGLSQGDAANSLKNVEAADELLSFHYRLKTGESRINAPAFVESLRLLRELQSCRAAGTHDNPATYFSNGTAALAIVSLRDLYQIQASGNAVRGKFGIAPVPGSRYTLVLGQDGKVERVPTRGNSVNRIPYLGARTLVGLVSKDCPNPTLAWEFLAGLAVPDKMGAEVITAGKWGAGPFRYIHIEERGRFLWYGYDLPRDDTENLIAALKEQLQPNIVNPCYCLRLPNEKSHSREFDAVVRAALVAQKSDPQQSMNELARRWSGLWKDVPEHQRKPWVRMCYGLPAE
jgi:multiple sugar transport system substrate-binding protein